MKLFLWLLQIIAEMVRNLVMASWLTYTVSQSWLGIFHMVDVVSYRMFAMVVACKKEDCRETIVDQRNVDIGKAADAVVQTEYMYEELSTKNQSVHLLKFRGQCILNVKQVKDCVQKLGISSSCVRSITTIYLEGTRCFSRVTEGVKG